MYNFLGVTIYRRIGIDYQASTDSAIMYDFLVSNDLAVVDFQIKQTTKYTYFSFKSNIFTWIDHVASNAHDLKNVTLMS